MAKALKIIIAVVLGLLFCVKVLPILAAFFALNSFFDKDDMELDKKPRRCKTTSKIARNS
ncbi:hypothetical protein [uncultured Campylobacter sp.]|uniref:hypothetical protein n=1 Tax=uncultured Campylobacter sp. TaxID=218934 RepID=UPI0025E0475D|nr:hypothetical protein [uncultured Campylobacter sp.]